VSESRCQSLSPEKDQCSPQLSLREFFLFSFTKRKIKANLHRHFQINKRNKLPFDKKNVTSAYVKTSEYILAINNPSTNVTVMGKLKAHIDLMELNDYQ
jgi:hypothetical protein